MSQIETCGRGYAQSAHRCEKPKGHREDSESVYSDPDGSHRSGGLWWTNKRSTKKSESDPDETQGVDQ